MEALKKDNRNVEDRELSSLIAHEQPWISQNLFNNDSFQTSNSEYYFIEIITSGTIVISCQGARTCTFQPGDVWLGPTKTYKTEASLDFDAIRICFDSLYYAHCLYPLLPLPRFPSDKISTTVPAAISVHPIQNDIDRLNLHLQATDTNSPILIRHTLHQLALRILTLVPNGCLPVPQSKKNNKQFIGKEFGYFLEANYLRRFTVAELGMVMGKSMSSFKRFFAANYRSTPVQWLINRRLHYAYFLLHCGQYSFETVAVLSGFSEVSHFMKQFKRQFGISPRALRRQIHADMKRSTLMVTNLHFHP